MKTRTLIAPLVLAVLTASNLLHAQVNQIGGVNYESGPSGFDGSEWYQYSNDTGHTINISVTWSDNYNSGGISNAGDPGVPTTGNVAPGGTFWLATYSYNSSYGPFYSVQRSFSYSIVSSPVTISWSTSTPTFNGSQQTGATASISPAGAATVSGNSAIYAGNYTASASLFSSDYYWASGQQTSVNWSIAKATRNLNVSGTPSGTTGISYPFYASQSAGGGTITWDDNSTGGFNNRSWSAEGTYPVSATISGDPNYQDASGGTSISIGHLQTYSVTVNISPAAAAAAGCSASASPPSGIGFNGSTTLSANAASGWQFTGWTGDSPNSITSDITVTANFSAVGSVGGSISASPSSATEPGATTISWSTSNATSVSVSGAGVSSSAASGSQSVSGLSAGSYTYTLTAQGPGGPITQSATFTVSSASQPSVTGSISASPSNATEPGATTISWSTSNATSVSVSGTGVSSSAASGSQSVSGLSAGSYTYTLTAQGNGGPFTQTATFTVSAASQPNVDGSISVSPSTTSAPGSATVSWSTSNATSVSVSGPGMTTSTWASSSAAVSSLSAGSYTYTLTAQGNGGPITRTATLTVLPAGACVDGSITVSPSWDVGGSYVIWSTSNATSVSVSGAGLSSTTTSGNQAVTGLPVGVYTYTLTAQGPGGPITRTATFYSYIYVDVQLLVIDGKYVYTDSGTTDDSGDEIYWYSPEDYGWSVNPVYQNVIHAGDQVNFTLTHGSVYRFAYWADWNGHILSYSPNLSYAPTICCGIAAWFTNTPAKPLTITLGGSKIYDGTTASTGATAAITAGSLSTSNGGETISYTYAATPSANVGIYTGFITATIRDSSNQDVTWKYAITYNGNYTITPASQTVTILPAAATVTAGSSQIFTAAGGHNPYTWGGSASGTGLSQSVTFPTAGTFTVTVQSPAGGNYTASNVAPATVIVNPAAQTLTLSLTPLVSNYTVNDASSPLNGKTYKRVWQDDGVWHAYLGRSGDQFQIVGQATTTVQAFELQALEPNADPSAWYSLATIPPPSGSPNGPGVGVTGVFSVSLDTASAAAALVPQSYAQGNPKTGVWQLRARTQDSSGTWSDWSNIVAVTVDLPLTTTAVPAQTLPPAGPTGGWFTASDQTTFKLPVWIP